MKKSSDISENDSREEVKMGGIQNVTFHILAGQTAARKVLHSFYLYFPLRVVSNINLAYGSRRT